MKNNFMIRLIKCIDISLIGNYYLILGIITSIILNKIYKETDSENIGNIHLSLKIFSRTALIMVAAYIMRQIVKRIPSAFDGMFGYKHSRVKEIQGGVIIAFSIIVLQKGFKSDIELIIKRLENY